MRSRSLNQQVDAKQTIHLPLLEYFLSLLLLIIYFKDLLTILITLGFPLYLVVLRGFATILKHIRRKQK